MTNALCDAARGRCSLRNEWAAPGTAGKPRTGAPVSRETGPGSKSLAPVKSNASTRSVFRLASRSPGLRGAAGAVGCPQPAACARRCFTWSESRPGMEPQAHRSSLLQAAVSARSAGGHGRQVMLSRLRVLHLLHLKRVGPAPRHEVAPRARALERRRQAARGGRPWNHTAEDALISWRHVNATVSRETIPRVPRHQSPAAHRSSLSDTSGAAQRRPAAGRRPCLHETTRALRPKRSSSSSIRWHLGAAPPHLFSDAFSADGSPLPINLLSDCESGVTPSRSEGRCPRALARELAAAELHELRKRPDLHRPRNLASTPPVARETCSRLKRPTYPVPAASPEPGPARGPTSNALT